MDKVQSGVLAGIDISAEKAKEVRTVATVEQAIEVMREANDHTATETALESLMGVENRSDEKIFGNYQSPADARATVLTGVEIGEKQNETMDEVADTVEAMKDALNNHAVKEQPAVEKLGNALSAAMGVQPDK